MKLSDTQRIGECLAAIITSKELLALRAGSDLQSLITAREMISQSPPSDDIMLRAIEDRARQARIIQLNARIATAEATRKELAFELAVLRRKNDLIIETAAKMQKRAAQQRARRMIED